VTTDPVARAVAQAAGGSGPIAEEPLGDGSRYRVPAAARTLALLEFLAGAREPHGVSALARRLGIPKSSCFSLLATLEEAGYVRRTANDEWTLTLRIYHLGLSAAQNVDILLVALPILNELCDSTGLTSHLGIFEGGSIVYALKVDPPEGMVKFDTQPGKVASVHLTAIGRATASVLADRDLDQLLDGYEFVGGDNSRIHNRESFMAELHRVRQRGFCFENEEETFGVSCIAAPVSYGAGEGAAVGITALTVQVQEQSVESISSRVMRAAASLSALLNDHVSTG
jgi:DNA-binding IclR family transcriptional regulator